MTQHPLQPGWIDRPHQHFELGDFVLDSGEVLRDAQLCWVLHGELPPQGGEAVLALSAIGGNHHRLDFLIGPGRALDPARHAVLCIDALGNGLSSSPSNSRRQPGLAFPRFSIGDMVRAQKQLVDHLGIGRLAAVVGASMGGMQALHWAVAYPDRMRKLVAMTPMARTSAWAAAVNAAARGALMADPRWAEPGHASAGMQAWIAVMQLLSGRTPGSLESEFDGAAAMQHWLDQRLAWQRGQGTHPIDWVWQSHAYDAHDVGRVPGFGGDTAAALASVRADTLVLAPPLDLYNPRACAEWVARHVPGARLVQIDSPRGHQSAGAARAQDAAFLNDVIGEFLRSA